MFKQYETAILDSLYAIAERKDLSALSGPMDRLMASLGYGGYSFGLIWGEEHLIKGSAGLVGGNLGAVVPAYLDADMTARDPMAQSLLSTRDPVLWSPFLREASQPGYSGPMLEISQLLSSNGISTGVTIPVDLAAVACRAALAVSAAPHMDMERFETQFRETGWVLRLTALSLGHTLGNGLIARVRTELSNSEQRVLKALSLGLRPREIAERMGKSEHTIRNQIVSAQQRLGASTKEQAIARALRFGLLQD